MVLFYYSSNLFFPLTRDDILPCLHLMKFYTGEMRELFLLFYAINLLQKYEHSMNKYIL